MPTSQCLQHNISIISFWLSSNRAESGKWQMAASSLLHNINAVTDSCSTNLTWIFDKVFTAWILCKFHYFFLYIKCIIHVLYSFMLQNITKVPGPFLSVICKMYVFIRTIIMLKMCLWNIKNCSSKLFNIAAKTQGKTKFLFSNFCHIILRNFAYSAMQWEMENVQIKHQLSELAFALIRPTN